MLYVEDDASKRTLMQDLLAEESAIEMRTAPDALAGLSSAIDWHPHLILLDLDLPGVSGFELLHQLRATPSAADLPCVAVSGFAMEHDITAAMSRGFAGYLTKPVEHSKLIELIEQHGRRAERLDKPAA